MEVSDEAVYLTFSSLSLSDLIPDCVVPCDKRTRWRKSHKCEQSGPFSENTMHHV